MHAIILAAGMGKRLKELTSNATKCMVEVCGITMIERMLRILDKKNLSKIVVVVGYEGKKLEDYIQSLHVGTPVVFVNNSIYDRTNNIYSLHLAKDYLLEEDTLLLESDLIFEERALDRLIDAPYPSLTLVAKFESWMDGTVVELDEEDNIKSFLSKKDFHFSDIESYYKTVNIYKFSKDFSVSHYVPFLEAYSKALGNNQYYEQVLKGITMLDNPDIKAVRLEDEAWYEIDDKLDLDIAESLFADKSEKLQKMQRRFGGYWRYPHLMDFCYLVNPFFPNQKLMDEMQANFGALLCNYPSGMDVNSLLAANFFSLGKEHIVAGNGAAELIKALTAMLPGKMGIIFPTFEEYPNRKGKDSVVAFCPKAPNFSYTADDIIAFFTDKGISALTLVNPDNPSGNYIPKAEVLRLARWAETQGIRLIADESFVDFADTAEPETLLSRQTMAEYPQLIVVKSISKSYGVPGLRLGVVASGDAALINAMKTDVAIWNINSFAEFFMQIFGKYQSLYTAAMKKFYGVRAEYFEALKAIPGLRPLPSQANYLLCEVLPPHNAHALTETLLDEHHILIKDLTPKKGFDGGQYIRVAVKTPAENAALVKALDNILK